MTVSSPDLKQSPKVLESPAKESRKEAWRRRLPLLPALIFAIVVTQVPFVLSLYYSLTNWVLVPVTPREFVWFENYVDMFSSSRFRGALMTSVTMTVGAVLLSVFFGLLIALLLDRKFFGKGFARTLLITPFLVMPVVASLVWSNQMFNSTFGVLNWVLETLGFDTIQFTSSYPLGSIIAVLVWQWTPFMMLIILAGLQGQSSSVLEAARVDGASPRATFFQITLPYLRPYLELGTLLGVIYISQVFDQIEVLTGGIANSKNVPYFVYNRSIGGGWLFGEASAYSIVVVILSIIAATFGLRVLSGLLDDGDTA